MRALAALTALTEPRRAETRRAGYGDPGQHRLLVFAVDEYGMMSRDARSLLVECIAVREDRLDVKGSVAILRGRAGYSLAFGSGLSVTLARRLACVILPRAQGDYFRM